MQSSVFEATDSLFKNNKKKKKAKNCLSILYC